MKGCLKPAVTLVGIALILGAVATLLLASQADTYLKWGVEKGVTAAAGAPAHIERFQILPMRQRIQIDGLVLDNPPGWKAAPALNVKTIVVNLDAKSLFSENPRIPSIEVNGATVNLDYDLARGLNISQLAKSGDAALFSPQVSPGTTQMEDSDAKTGQRPHFLGRRFQVEKCQCRDVKLCVGGIAGKVVNLDLAPFTLEELPGKPVSVGEATGIFLRSVLTETVTLKGLLAPVGEKIQEQIRQFLGQAD